MIRKSTHVVHRKNGTWSVKSGGAKRAYRNFSTKKEAVDVGRRVSSNKGSELVIHNMNGRIARCDSHGNDPCPPRDSH